MPEDLPAEQSIKPLMDERQKARKKVSAQKTQSQLSMFDGVEQTNSTSIQETQEETGENARDRKS